jgi:hypothetical protein
VALVGFDGRPHCKRRRRGGKLALAGRRHYQKLREALLATEKGSFLPSEKGANPVS